MDTKEGYKTKTGSTSSVTLTLTLTLPAGTPVPLVTTLLPLVGRRHLLSPVTSMLLLFNTPYYCI